ncbi:MAG: amidase [Hyphomicrobiaceae bacterium]|nr:amidase [Hyphomicrobiaceae bacterium]
MTLAHLTAHAAAEAMRRGDITSEELVSACLERIDAREPDVGAFAHLDREQALADARAADHARRAGRGFGRLNGVPIAVKDIIDTAGRPTEHGTPIHAGRRALQDAACVAALKSAGAVILGKTVTTELALLTPARTRNPVDPTRSPGGSSAGSAAAVADAMVPVALGSQTAGSVLRPASYCGVYGFKPTFGLISRRGVLMQSHTLDTVGLFARDIADLALITDCLGAHDPDDPASYPRSAPNHLDIALSPAPLPPRLALIKTPAWETHASPALREAFGELAAELGADCVEVDLAGLDAVIEWQRLVQLAENGGWYGRYLDHAGDLLSPGLRARLEEGSRVPVRAYLDAIAAREAAYTQVAEVLDDFTAILTPAAPGVAPLLSEGITGSPIFNGLWTYLGMPAVSVPLLEVDGLPLGVQLVAARQDDGRLLRTARALVERLTPA